MIGYTNCVAYNIENITFTINTKIMNKSTLDYAANQINNTQLHPDHSKTYSTIMPLGVEQFQFFRLIAEDPSFFNAGLNQTYVNIYDSIVPIRTKVNHTEDLNVYSRFIKYIIPKITHSWSYVFEETNTTYTKNINKTLFDKADNGYLLRPGIIGKILATLLENTTYTFYEEEKNEVFNTEESNKVFDEEVQIPTMSDYHYYSGADSISLFEEDADIVWYAEEDF
jgi:hypothetical protein